jgi:DMSO/TMAO reductase YedYZ molybdopterin-dependent catalytic subunit
VRLITIEDHPYNAETPMRELSRVITPIESFFVRSHFDIPDLNPSTHRLQIEGAVRLPLSLDLSEIKALPERRITATLECAGNGRIGLEPKVPGVRWAFGAASTAHFKGASLHHLLDRAGIEDSAVEAVFVGADCGEVEPGRTVPFERSLPISLARHPDTLLTWEMNGEPLTPLYGSPLRLLVPRWYAVASVKWLTRIRIVTQPFQGHYQTEKYVYEQEAGIPDKTPVSLMRVRAVIARPAEGETLPRDKTEISGMAWAGQAPIRKVDVSVDGGRSWMAATLGPAPSEQAWTPWSLSWSPASPGEHLLLARGTDATGQTQPLTQTWNIQGYGNNVAHKVRVKVS